MTDQLQNRAPVDEGKRVGRVIKKVAGAGACLNSSIRPVGHALRGHSI